MQQFIVNGPPNNDTFFDDFGEICKKARKTCVHVGVTNLNRVKDHLRTRFIVAFD